jgi:hypothetical protein
MDEVGELPGLIAGEEESGTAHEEDLRAADPRGVELVVDDHGARALQRDGAAVLAEALRRAPVRLTECPPQRDLDTR